MTILSHYTLYQMSKIPLFATSYHGLFLWNCLFFHNGKLKRVLQLLNFTPKICSFWPASLTTAFNGCPKIANFRQSLNVVVVWSNCRLKRIRPPNCLKLSVFANVNEFHWRLKCSFFIMIRFLIFWFFLMSKKDLIYCCREFFFIFRWAFRSKSHGHSLPDWCSEDWMVARARSKSSYEFFVFVFFRTFNSLTLQPTSFCQFQSLSNLLMEAL